MMNEKTNKYKRWQRFKIDRKSHQHSKNAKGGDLTLNHFIRTTDKSSKLAAVTLKWTICNTRARPPISLHPRIIPLEHHTYNTQREREARSKRLWFAIRQRCSFFFNQPTNQPPSQPSPLAFESHSLSTPPLRHTAIGTYLYITDSWSRTALWYWFVYYCCHCCWSQRGESLDMSKVRRSRQYRLSSWQWQHALHGSKPILPMAGDGRQETGDKFCTP